MGLKPVNNLHPVEPLVLKLQTVPEPETVVQLVCQIQTEVVQAANSHPHVELPVIETIHQLVLGFEQAQAEIVAHVEQMPQEMMFANLLLSQ